MTVLSIKWPQKLLACTIFLLCLIGCGPKNTPAAASWQPTLRLMPCSGADLPGFKSRCGFAELEKQGIQLSFAVIEPLRTNQSIPVAFLAGGPGEGGNTTYKLDEWRYWASDIGLARPVVLWQPRGTQGSSKYFECDSFNAWLKSEALGDDSSMLMAMESCFVQWRVQLGKSGFEQFSSRQSARDLTQILQLLGFERWHLWASSYGGSAAHWMLHENTERVASVIFDSAVTRALQKPSDFAARWVASMKQLFARACEVHGCNSSQLESDFWLAAENVQTHFSKNSRGNSGVSKDVFAHWVFAQGFDEASAKALPELLERFKSGEVHPGDMAQIEQFISAKTAPANNPWVYYATLCGDLKPQTQSEYQVEVSKLGRWQQFWQHHELIDICPLLGGGAQASEWAAGTQHAPVLFLAGRFDPLIAFDAVKAQREHFSAAAVITSESAAHGLLRSQKCGGGWARSFWQAPAEFIAQANNLSAADLAGCIAEM